MRPASDTIWRGGGSALLASYAADVRKWAAKLAGGYAVAVAMLGGGVLALFAAFAVGVTALFHVLERYYGSDIAYGAIGGGLLVLAIGLLLTGWTMLRRRMPPLPRPRRQVRAAKRLMTGPAVLGAVTRLTRARAAATDPVTQVLIGAAAILLVGWLVASQLRSRSDEHRV